MRTEVRLIGPDGQAKSYSVVDDPRGYSGSYGTDYIKDLLQQGYTPDYSGGNITQNNLHALGLEGYIQGGLRPDPNPYTQGLDQAREAADQIMNGYRNFGEGNNWDREYGENNPYMDRAMEGIDRLKDMAYSTGPTDYANALLDEQNLIKQIQGEDLQKSMSGDLATSYSRLAESGGLDTGMRERLASNNMTQGIMSRQRLGMEDATARRGILSNDASFRQNLATQIPGMYNPYAQGAERWQQDRTRAREQYEQDRERERYATIGNIYGRERE